jgi:hypothetical protein
MTNTPKDAKGHGRVTARASSAAALLLLITVLVLHCHVASVILGSSLVSGDPQRHFVSGVMCYDYLRTGLGSNPIHFAEGFEVRYPEVAIGHWPPMYYAVQAFYYFLARPTIRSAQLLSAITAALLAALLFLSIRRKAGVNLAMVAVAVFLAAPLVQAAAWQVMSDLLTALFVFVAVRSFSELLDSPRDSNAALSFVVWASAAILTKGSAWALGPFALLAPVLARRLNCFRNIQYWFAGIGVIVLSAPFYVIVQRIGIGYQGYYAHIASPALSLTDRISILMPLAHFAPVLLLLLSAFGLVEALYARWHRNDDSSWTTFSLACGVWILAQAIFLFVLPLTGEARVLLPSLAPATVLAARSLLWVQRALLRWPLAVLAMPIVIGAAVIATSGIIPLQRIDGYREATNAIPYSKEGSLIFSASGNIGEGALIAERLGHGLQHNDVILRANHVFMRTDSLGNCFPLLTSAEAMRTYLLQLPVRFVVLSNQPFGCRFGDGNADQANRWINRAVTEDPVDFKLVATFPILEKDHGQTDELRLYENPTGRIRHPRIVQTPLGLDARGRVLEYRWP